MTNTELAYTGIYTDWTREAILAEVEKQMKPSRFQHVLRVEASSIQLAEKYGASVEACSLAALLHDYAKEHAAESMKEIVLSEGMDSEMTGYGSEIMHGPVGAYYAETVFGIKDEAILDAIRQHTIGGEMMTLIGKVLFIADYIESGRAFKGVDEARRLAEDSLDEAAYFKIEKTIIHLVKKELPIYPGTIYVYNSWIQRKVGKS
ncbi:bis(5'-nucleosyl)-tetraphosphatase (symmetrical) YqeK [Trichococcus sp. K1Tr]|uniref:bis(5'-nucleosyl)-tetraphosphatase (symmetrical) YqeK n=1 Tax=Trichococcus sp. K1Tr TaxID=3020847 RepID=UPI00232A8708|nr:bis(5'-nucleosyl)-tetraphosphatase (symmetrical) YqeK [Trichococcus sp. K1Tr]MDB6352523.1 bis(5'-nucleosyl)-tetraphosphatase (symmetrical) YqeK [Trichococcus sp. K1Tr]